MGKGDLVAIYLEADQILDLDRRLQRGAQGGRGRRPDEQPAVAARGAGHPRARRSRRHRRQRRVRARRWPRSSARSRRWPSWSRSARRSRPGSSTSRSVKSADADAIQVPVDDDDLADVMYTSGTTGSPKGVAVRHGNVAMVPNAPRRGRGTGWLTATPVFTFAGLGFIYNPMKAGMTVLYLPGSTPGDGSRSSSASAGDRLRGPGHGPAPHPPSPVRHRPTSPACRRLILGSAPLAPDTLLRLQARLPRAAVLNSYGMTEGGHATFAMDPEGSRTRPGAVGRPRPPVEVRIVDDEGNAVPDRRGRRSHHPQPRGHREYYKDPEATARMWEGGWLHTGDLGYLDADGYLYIVGRKKEMIVRGGMNIYADDVEAVAPGPPGGGRGRSRRHSPRGAGRGHRRLSSSSARGRR